MKIPKFVSHALLSAALGVALGTAPVTHANPILIGNGYANGSEQFSVTAPTTTANAGAFAGTLNGQPIIFFCFELTQFFYFGVPYSDYVVSNPSNAKFDLLSRLFTEAFDQVLLNTDNSAAFQLAVWEILYDPSPTNLSSGTFHVTNDFGHPGTVALATTWLNNLPAVGTYSITWLHSPDEQDFVFGTSTLREAPEPSLLFLASIGLAAMGFAMRRRASQ
jgi:hypothetical protein